MNWDDIRYFLALCREGSISAAGKTLGVTHTTVARRISALENELATRLFDRSPDGYAMTQAAENMYDNAVRMEARAQAIDRQTFGRDAQLSGALRITVPYDFAIEIVVPSLGRFRHEYPAIDVELMTTTGLVDLAAREADLAIRLTPKPPEFLVGREILPLRHGIYTAPSYWKKAGKDPQVILFPGERTRPAWVRQHFPNACTAMRTDNVKTMVGAVRAGLGIARLPCFIGDRETGVRRIDRPLTPSKWGIWILSHVDLRSTARVRAAREFFAGAIENQRELILGKRSKYVEGRQGRQGR